MSTSTSTERFIPARLSFLAIYNPSIAPRDETLEEQVVFCYSRKRHRARLKRRKSNVTITTEAAVDAQRNEQNEMLRQIGLAQGMVEFAKTFSNGQPVDSIETDKTRIVLLELERGWWIYVSIDLTRFPRSAISNSSPQYEYSAREVSTPILLRQQLFHAHSIFLLHHGRCLDGLYSKLGREKFCSVLDGFWTRFARTWDVLLHGNPAVEALRGIKLAAGGELGIGVGEEEWGSGEREVLEGFVRRTDGLVDLMVSRFGVDDIRKARMEREDIEDDRDAHVAATDGVVFTGVGALTRSSSRAVAGWVEWLHLDGVRAYGVDENPKSTGRRRREGSKSRTEAAAGKMNGGGSLRPKAAHKSSTSQLRTPETDTRSRNHTGTPSTSTRDSKTRQSISEKATENHPVEKSGSKLMKYMTLGYGSSWGGTPKTAEVGIDGAGTGDSNMAQTTPRAANRRGHSEGFFLIGLRGDLNEQPEKEESNDDDGNSHSSPKMDSGHDSDVENDEQRHDRIMLRTVHVHLNKPYNDHQTESNERFRTLQVVVYQRTKMAQHHSARRNPPNPITTSKKTKNKDKKRP
ncbi:MAG: hypothetical protein M1823_002942 [Watsoniomyces obsoletus]|nr:MAG: hypothetical protein M1823_002942 [Watsoniomyces obsoletus]